MSYKDNTHTPRHVVDIDIERMLRDMQTTVVTCFDNRVDALERRIPTLVSDAVAPADTNSSADMIRFIKEHLDHVNKRLDAACDVLDNIDSQIKDISLKLSEFEAYGDVDKKEDDEVSWEAGME